MATDKQIAANQRNAQHCTGPQSPSGKGRSSQNAFKTGIDAKSEIIRYESRAEHDELVAAFHARFAPATPEEASLVDALVRFEWLSRRYICVDTAVWERRFNQHESNSLGGVFLDDSEKLSRAVLLFNSVRRGFNATLKQLTNCQANRAKSAAKEPDEHPPAASAIPPAPAPISETAPTAETIQTVAETAPLKPQLVSFLINATPLPTLPDPAPETPSSSPKIDEDPPIAA